MLWEKKTQKQICENSQKRGYLYLRLSQYRRDKRTLKKKAKHLGDGSAYKERNKHIVKKDYYLGRIMEITPNSFLSFQDYIIVQLQKESDYLNYVLHNSFEEIFFDFVSYLQELYNFSISISKQEIKHNSLEFLYLEKKSKKTFALKTGGFFNIILLKRVYDFIPQKRDEITQNDFKNFSNRCLDAGIFDDYVQMILYVKTLNTHIAQSVEEEIFQLDMSALQNRSENSFEDFMRKMHKE